MLKHKEDATAKIRNLNHLAEAPHNKGLSEVTKPRVTKKLSKQSNHDDGLSLVSARGVHWCASNAW